MIEAPERTKGSKTDSTQSTRRVQGWFQELRRRHIFKVTAAYLVLAWLLMQVAAVLESSLKLPDWTDTFTFAILMIGFPIALFVTWAVDLTPEKATPEALAAENSQRRDNAKSDTLQTDEIFRRPSIAVLPFNNMSGDPQQEFFADGLTEDIITALSRCRLFPVIARNSTFSYKGQSPDVRKVAKELGAAYVLEGSVRTADDQLRVNVQLIRGDTGEHIWAEKYDRKIENIFKIQDEIVETIAGTLQPELGKAEQHRATLQQPDNLDAWYAFQRGMWHYQRRTKEDYDQATLYFKKAIELEPSFAPSYSSLAILQFFILLFNWTNYRDELSEEIISLARKAVEIDPGDSMSYTSLGCARIARKEHAQAIPILEKATQLDPNNFVAPQMLGIALIYCQDAKKAAHYLTLALRLSPRDPLIAATQIQLARAYYFMDDLQLAESMARKALANRLPAQIWVAVSAIAILNDAGYDSEISEILRQLLVEHPYLSCKYVEEHYPLSVGKYYKKYISSLRKAGLPEHAPSET